MVVAAVDEAAARRAAYECDCENEVWLTEADLTLVGTVATSYQDLMPGWDAFIVLESRVAPY